MQYKVGKNARQIPFGFNRFIPRRMRLSRLEHAQKPFWRILDRKRSKSLTVDEKCQNMSSRATRAPTQVQEPKYH